MLDYCRVKKIFDKGFGFLTSLYYKEPVFFHFQRVKDPAVKEKLEKLKRGEVYLFFTSGTKNGKRRVLKLWLDIKDADKNLLPDFVVRIKQELNGGKINIFEIAYVIKQLRMNNFLEMNDLREIISSEKMLKTPSLIKAILLDDELNNLETINILVEKLESKNITNKEWISSIEEIFINKTIAVHIKSEDLLTSQRRTDLLHIKIL